MDCKNPVVPGRRKCETHLARQKQYQKNAADKRKAKGLCTVCGDRALPRQRLCRLCNTSALASQRRMREQRLQAGLCVQCGERRFSKGFRTCKPCRKHEKNRHKEYRKRVKLRRQRAGEFRRLFAAKPMAVALRMEQLRGMTLSKRGEGA